MRKSNLIYAIFLVVFCFSSCQQTKSKTENQAQNTDLDDIIESPPEKKVNQSPSSEKTKTSVEKGVQTTIGTFATIEQGDYYYLIMKDEKNVETSFMLWQAYEGAADLNIDNEASVRGKKIKVTWETSVEDIPEAGEKMEIKKVLAVEILG